MNTFYGIKTKIFDNGKIEVSRITAESYDKPENIIAENHSCDLYVDWFESKMAADLFFADALAEGAKVV
ncbi:MAG: hypothetical protein IKB96_10610 [Prevotella sp.]|nr:hypothetical protein [Prevotella sp.]